MEDETGRLRYTGLLTLLFVCALALAARVVYLFLADAERFPITTVKIAANYQHISRKELESVLAGYLNTSFFSLPIRRLHADLLGLAWSEQVYIERIWPNTLKITLVEKTPVAIWNQSLMDSDGELFNVSKDQAELNLPRLNGPVDQQTEVLQIYQKLSKLLSIYGLQAASLQLRDNQAWDLVLTNGVQLRLGKKDLEKRLLRFCKAYPHVFAEKSAQLASVDLRYARGMAVRWKNK
ncbi:MAG: cell division protein FtsQ/DivIB [Legionellales bacterium]|nr:cell division protein FtsQ/DivIB [Legionellales bacterium]